VSAQGATSKAYYNALTGMYPPSKVAEAPDGYRYTLSTLLAVEAMHLGSHGGSEAFRVCASALLLWSLGARCTTCACSWPWAPWC
jgi:hypothetical protein